MTNRLPEPGTLWTLGTWRCIFTGTSLQLHVGPLRITSVHANSAEDIERISAGWKRSAEGLVALEQEVR